MPLPEEIASTLPEDIRSDPSLASFNDVGGLAKSYVETKKMVGGMTKVPDEAAPKEEQDKWWQEFSPKLKQRGLIESAPDSPEHYEFKFDGIADETVKNDGAMKLYRGIAHEMGLSNAKAQKFVERLAKEVLPGLLPKPPEFIEGDAAKALVANKFKGETTQRVDNYKAAITSLKADYPQLEDLLKDSVTSIDGKAISFFDHPVIVELFSDIGQKFKQDFGGSLNALAAGDTLESVQAEINAINNDTNNPWYKGYHQGSLDDPAKAKMMELYKKKELLLARQKKAS